MGPWPLNSRDRDAGSDFSLALALTWWPIYSAQGGTYLSVLGCQHLFSHRRQMGAGRGRWASRIYDLTNEASARKDRRGRGPQVLGRACTPPSLHPSQMPSAQIRGAAVPLS